MRAGFLAICKGLDRLVTLLCGAACVVLTASVLVIVILRFGFDAGNIKLQNLAEYAFAVLMILSLPYCLRRGGHVRVEVLSDFLPRGYGRIADWTALLIFLVPVFGLMIYAWLPDLIYSWTILEGSVETGGLGGMFLVKTMLPLSALTMILVGIAALLEPETSKQ